MNDYCDGFLETSLFPRSSGLPVTISVGLRGTVAARPRAGEGAITPGVSAAVDAWVALNYATLAAHWAGEIDSAGLTEAIAAKRRA